MVKPRRRLDIRKFSFAHRIVIIKTGTYKACTKAGAKNDHRKITDVQELSVKFTKATNASTHTVCSQTHVHTKPFFTVRVRKHAK